MAKRGFTLVELLFVIVLTSIVMGASVSLYSFSITRLGQGTARYTSEDQARKLIDEIESVVQDSVSVVVITSGTKKALKCTLAQQSTRSFSALGASSKTATGAAPTNVTRRAFDRQGSGTRVWFYLADSTGTFGTSGSIVWRADRSDDTAPGTSDALTNWAYYSPGNPRFPLITTFTFSVDSANKTATVTAQSMVLWRAERAAMSTDKMAQTFSETRTMGWRHWFQ